MWIQELFIDAFDGTDDLNLNGLSKTLNIIRLPTENEAKQLGRFVPGILYGICLGNSRPRGGVIGLQIPQGNRDERLLDLSRVVLPDAQSLSDLQILGPVLEEEVAGLLETVGSDFFMATFTDALPPAERVAVWRASPTILQHAQPSVPTSPGSIPVARTIGHWSATTDILERWSRIRQQVDRVGIDPHVEEPLDMSSPEQVGSARREYLAAHENLRSLQQSLPRLRDRVAEQETKLATIQRAMAIADAWHEQLTLRKKLFATPNSSVTSDDVEHLRQLEQQLSDRRAKLREARKSKPSSSSGSAHALERSQKHLQHWDACDRMLAHRRSLQALLDKSMSPKPSVADEFEQAVAELRRTAQSGWHRSLESESLHPEVTTPDERVDRLQRQIRQLRDETRRLLARQRLSRRSLTWIGTLFATGVAIMLISLVFNLDGAELSTGAIGLTCVIAATLLKFSFERTPSERLRYQRLKITQLLEEVSQVREATNSIKSSHHAPAPSLTLPEIDSADWSKLLSTYGLPDHLSANEAIEELRHRVVSAPSYDDVDRSRLQHEIADCDRKIRQWCQRAAKLLPELTDQLATDSQGAPRWYQLLREEHDRLQEFHADFQQQFQSEREHAIATLQQQIRELKKERRNQLAKFNAAGVADLEKQLARRDERKHLIQRRKAVQIQIESALEGDPDRNKIQEWLDHSTSLTDRLERQQVEFAKSQAALLEAQNQSQTEQQRIETASSQRAAIRQQPQQPISKIQLTELDLAAAICQFQIEHTKPSTVAKPQSGKSEPVTWIKRANDQLHRLTDNSDCEIRWSAYDEPLEFRESTETVSFEQINSARQHLVVLALQLALCELVREEIGRFPLILRDASLRHPLAVCRHIAQRILEISQQGQQVLLITSQEAVTHLFHELSIPTLVVSRHTSSDPTPLLAVDSRVPNESSQPTIASPVDTLMPTEEVEPAVAEAILRERRVARDTAAHPTDAIFADKT